MRGRAWPLALLAGAMLAGCATEDGPNTPGPSAPVPDTTPSQGPDTPPPSSSTTTARPTPRPSSSPTAGPPPPDPSPSPTAPPPVAAPTGPIVAVLDTGILATHEAFAAGQVVAWYDFGKGGRSTVPGTIWDPDTEPYDDNGHGTAVASMVAGQGAHTPSHAPGVRLAIAKISGPSGGAHITDMANAVMWASDVVGAKVISISFYGTLPDPISPAFGHPVLDALERARGRGTLPVVLAGNGMFNAGLPTLSWMHSPAGSRAALVVGGAYASGNPTAPISSMDPEVTAFFSVDAACPDSDTCYDGMSGTSFSTPLVAGMAARILQACEEAGVAQPDSNRLERLLKLSARDTTYPPTLEGYGYLGEAELATAIEHALAGTLPPANLLNEAYVETVGQTARGAWGG